MSRNWRRLDPGTYRGVESFRYFFKGGQPNFMGRSLTQIGLFAVPERGCRDESVIDGDDLDPRTQTPTPRPRFHSSRSKYHPTRSFTMKSVSVTKPKITLAMMMCGVLSAACVGAASAATPDDETRSVAVRYSPQDVATQDGARALYRRLVKAAADVCPADTSSQPFISEAVRECREQSVARAVFKVNSPSLVAVYNTSSKRG